MVGTQRSRVWWTQRSRVWWVHRGAGYGEYAEEQGMDTEEQGMVGTQRSRVW